MAGQLVDDRLVRRDVGPPDPGVKAPQVVVEQAVLKLDLHVAARADGPVGRHPDLAANADVELQGHGTVSGIDVRFLGSSPAVMASPPDGDRVSPSGGRPRSLRHGRVSR
jgi:hypothetical protein